MEISITRALNTLKLLDSKINKQTGQVQFVETKKSKETKVRNGMMTVEEFTASVKADFQSVKDLIEQRKKLKSAIVKSNAETMVRIAEVEYSVADAIERKASIEYEKTLLGKLKQNFALATNKIESYNEKLECDIQRMVDNFVGKDSKDNKDVVETAQKMADNKRDNEKMVFVDPLEIRTLIDKMETEIMEFESEVDLALSEQNARTMIDFE